MHSGLALFILLKDAANRAYVADCVLWYVIDLKFDSALSPPPPPYLIPFRDMDTLVDFAMEIAKLGNSTEVRLQPTRKDAILQV